MKYKKDVKKDKEKLTEELSNKNNILLTKGPAYKNDIKNLITKQKSPYNFEEFSSKNYSFSTDPSEIELYCWKYKFYDIKDKVIKNCKVWSPYDQFISRGISFQRYVNQDSIPDRLLPSKTSNFVNIGIYKNKIQAYFLSQFSDILLFPNNIYCERNTLFLYDQLSTTWYLTSEFFFLEALTELTKTILFKVDEFMYDFFM